MCFLEATDMRICFTKEMRLLRALFLVALLSPPCRGAGLLLLYRPQDVSNACIFSQHLRYDISFGMGMSDTITLVFRTLIEMDYGCTVEVAGPGRDVFLLVVVRYPNAVSTNCAMNRDAFTLLKKWRCIRLCDVIEESIQTHYFTFHVQERLRFRFVSNSSINADFNAHFYQVSVTAARARPARGCQPRNESLCSIGDDDFCFTGGVVCDGIKNCGVDDWFDERKSQCSLEEARLGAAPAAAALLAALTALLALVHVARRCLPPLADSFFIFNANEDNRLCIDPLLVPGDATPPDIPVPKRTSIIPVSSSSSSTKSNTDKASQDSGLKVSDMELNPISTFGASSLQKMDVDERKPLRGSKLRSLTERIQETLKSFTLSRTRNSAPQRPNIA